MNLPEDEESGEPLTFFGLLEVLCDFERRLRELEKILVSTKLSEEES